MKFRSLLLVSFVALLVWIPDATARTTNLWRAFRKPDGLAETACVSVTLGAAGDVLVRHPRASKITVLDGYGIKTLPGPGTPNRVNESLSGQLWVVTRQGLAEFREGEWLSHSIPEIATQFAEGRAAEIPLLPVLQGRVLILLPDRLLRLDVGEAEEPPQVTVVLAATQSRLGRFTGMSLGRNGGLWISGSGGFANLPGPLRNLKAQEVCRDFLPREPMRLRNFRLPRETSDGLLTALAESPTGQLVLAGFDGQRWSACPLAVAGVQFGWHSGNRTCVVTRDTFFELQDSDATRTASEELPVRRIFDVAVEPTGAFWLATSDGLFRYAPAIWQKTTAAQLPAGLDLLKSQRTRKRADLQTLLGSSNSNDAGQPPTSPAGEKPQSIIAKTKWRTWLAAKNSDLWLGSRHQIAWRHQNSWTFFSSTNQAGPENVLAFAESPDGRIWCATPNKVWQFDGKNWLVLRAGFEHINGLRFSSDGTLWIATNKGLHRFVRGAWIENGPEDGLPSPLVQNVQEDERGGIWADTAAGPCRFTPEADPDPPRTFPASNSAHSHEFREGALVTLNFEGRDKWNVTVPSRLLFSYRLDEHEWTPFDELKEFSFVDLPLGKHYFQVRSMDRNGNIDFNPARLEFAVLVPWYRETRLVLILSGALGFALFFAALAVNRHHRLRLSYAEVERKVAERTRELELANRELLHSQKMTALGTLAAGIAHDFNNILSIIRGSTQIIEDNPHNPEKIRTRLDRIKTVVQQGAGIVEAMLGFSRTSEQTSGPCDINAVVDDTVKLLGDRFLREVEVRLDHGQDLPNVPVPRDFVQQVLLNFIFNAAEAMTDPKRIVIATRKLTKLPVTLILAPAHAENYLAISVQDFGSGITPENLPRVFEPFFTTKSLSARRGTGLGLSMAYELARKMEAALGVETAPGAGSTFTLILPVKET